MLGIIGAVLLVAATVSFLHWVQLYGFAETREKVREARRKPEFQRGIICGAGALLCVAVAAMFV